MRVEFEALDRFASRVHGLGLNVGAGRAYIGGHADFSWQEEGLIGLLRSAHETSYGALVGALRHLEHLLDKSAFELRFAEHYYATTDLANASALDRTFDAPPAPYGPLRRSPPDPHSPAYAWRDPTRHLTDPGEPEASIGEGYADPSSIFELVSPASWLNWLLRETVGFDVIGSLTKPFTGDWRALARYGLALDRLANCLADVGGNIRFATEQVGVGWTGNAARDARAYFTEVAAACVTAQSRLREISAQYQEAARGTWLFANQVAGVITAITDTAMVGGLGAAIGVGLGWTGLGAWAGGALTAAQVLRIHALINEASNIIQNATSALTGIAGLVMASTDLGDLASPRLPAQPYDHPAVT